MITVGIVKDWDWPDLLRQTPGGKGVWEGMRFILDPEPTCDFLVVLNNKMKTETRAHCPPENVVSHAGTLHERAHGLDD